MPPQRSVGKTEAATKERQSIIGYTKAGTEHDTAGWRLNLGHMGSIALRSKADINAA